MPCRFFLALLVLSAVPCRAQDAEARHTVFVEILGNAGLASLNFDTTNEHGNGFRIGGFVDPSPLISCPSRDLACRNGAERQPAAAFVVMMSQRLVGESRHKLELGLGVLLGHAETGALDFLPRAAITATLGYRLQPNPRKLGVRVGLTPIIGSERVLLRPGFSVSFGLPAPH